MLNTSLEVMDISTLFSAKVTFPVVAHGEASSNMMPGIKQF